MQYDVDVTLFFQIAIIYIFFSPDKHHLAKVKYSRAAVWRGFYRHAL